MKERNKRIIILSILLPFFMHLLVFGIKDSLYLFPLLVISLLGALWGYWFVKTGIKCLSNL